MFVTWQPKKKLSGKFFVGETLMMNPSYILFLAFLLSPRGCTTDEGSFKQSGRVATSEEFPFYSMVRITFYENNTALTKFCGGALIVGNLVLTSAHCLNHYDKEIDVFLGIEDLEQLDSMEAVPAETWAVDKDFDLVTLQHNIALIKLDEDEVSVNQTDRVKPINLPRLGEEKVFLQGQILEGFRNNQLTVSELEIFDDNEESCLQYENKSLILCAGFVEENIELCNIWVGSPLIGTRISGEKVLLGIVSHLNQRHPCVRKGRPVQFTEVSTYTHWIEEKTTQVEQNSRNMRSWIRFMDFFRGKISKTGKRRRGKSPTAAPE